MRGLVVSKADGPPVLQPVGPKGKVQTVSLQVAVVDQNVEHQVDASASVRHYLAKVQFKGTPSLRREQVMSRNFGEDRHGDLEVAVVCQSVVKALLVVEKVHFACGPEHLRPVDIGNVRDRNPLGAGKSEVWRQVT